VTPDQVTEGSILLQTIKGVSYQLQRLSYTMSNFRSATDVNIIPFTINDIGVWIPNNMAFGFLEQSEKYMQGYLADLMEKLDSIKG
jgi:hypothetical protein